MDGNRKELEELRRLDELEAKAAGRTVAPKSVVEKPFELAPQQGTVSERVGEYLFGPTEREEISPTELGVGAGLGAGISYLGPKALKYGGKAVGMIPTMPTRVGGKLMELGGEALEKVPLTRRLVAGGVGGTAAGLTEQVGEMYNLPRVVTLPASILTGGAVGYTTDLVSRATGIEARALAKELKDKGITLTVENLQQAGMARDEAERELARLQRIQRQLSEREQVAMGRAEARQFVPGEAEKRAVLDDVRAARVQAEYAAKSAGLNARQAADVVTQAENRVVNAQKSVAALENQMLAMPTISKEQFGKQLQTTTKKLYDDLVKERKQAAPFGTIIENAGNVPNISTEGIYASLTNQIKQTGNPVTRNVLTSVRNELVKDGKKMVTLANADSTKGYIDSIINAKQFGDTKLSKEIVSQLRKVKGELFETIRPQYPEYLNAMGQFRTFSRPLDIVERNAVLSPVIEVDPFSGAFKMQEAEVVGQIISKAKAGNKVFERLIEKNPDIKDAAKLYFTKDLFGKEAAPTEQVMRTWLKNNESVLKRIGIYDDFKNLRVARTTANEAVKDAKGLAKEAKKVFKVAEAAEKEAAQTAKSKSELMGAAEKRLAESLQTVEPIEKILARSAARARPAETAIGQRVGAVEKEIAGQQAIMTDLNNLQRDLERIPAKEIPAKVKSFVEKLASGKEQKLTPDQADQIKRQIDLAQEKFKTAEDAKRALSRIFLGAGILSMVGSGFQALQPSGIISYR